VKIDTCVCLNLEYIW